MGGLHGIRLSIVLFNLVHTSLEDLGILRRISGASAAAILLQLLDEHESGIIAAGILYPLYDTGGNNWFRSIYRTTSLSFTPNQNGPSAFRSFFPSSSPQKKRSATAEEDQSRRADGEWVEGRGAAEHRACV